MSNPSVGTVLEWMRYYRSNSRALEMMEGELESALYTGGGTAQYGIQSVMPKSEGGSSDKTYNEAIALLRYKDSKVMTKLYISVKFLENRSHRITRERHALVYYYRISGYTSEDIAKILGTSRTAVHNTLKDVAITIIGDDEYEV